MKAEDALRELCDEVERYRPGGQPADGLMPAVRRARAALASLEPCATCGGSGRQSVPPTHPMATSATIPCPACAAPPAEEPRCDRCGEDCSNKASADVHLCHDCMPEPVCAAPPGDAPLGHFVLKDGNVKFEPAEPPTVRVRVALSHLNSGRVERVARVLDEGERAPHPTDTVLVADLLLPRTPEVQATVEETDGR